MWQVLFSERPSLWIFDCVQIILESAILAGAAFVFKPNERSAGLAEVDELLDETLTEMGDTSVDKNRMSVGIGRPDLVRISEVEMDESPVATDLKERDKDNFEMPDEQIEELDEPELAEAGEID
jgi:hypothetical protein